MKKTATARFLPEMYKSAEILGVSRLALSNLVNAKNGVSPEMAIRLSKAFGSSPEVWLGLQMDYGLAQVQKKASRIKVKRAVCTGEHAGLV